jgi:hypothetical protein
LAVCLRTYAKTRVCMILPSAISCFEDGTLELRVTSTRSCLCIISHMTWQFFISRVRFETMRAVEGQRVFTVRAKSLWVGRAWRDAVIPLSLF